MSVFLDVDLSIVEKLNHFGFKKIAVKSPHELVRLDGPCIVILFHSKKLLLQGKKDVVEEISKLISSLGYRQEIKIEKEIVKKKFSKEIFIEIGSDESLKGDSFGGIVVAGVLVDEISKEKLKLIVGDSKNYSDEKIKNLAIQIKNILSPSKISVRNLSAEQYNSSLLNNKVTVLLNNLHKYVQDELDKNNVGEKKKITDKYPGCLVGDVIVEKAENKYVSVATASIIARNAAIMQFEKMSNELNFKVPKGSSHVTEALIKLKNMGKDPKKYVKLDFDNVKKIFN